jgi:hypothetical protein
MTSYNLTIDVLARIGLIVTRCAWIDEILGHILTHLIGADRAPMYIITQNVSASTVSDWLRTLGPLHLKDPPQEEGLRNLLAAADDIRRERNILAHGLWREGPEPNTAIVQTIRLDRAEIIREELCTVADLDDLIERCTEALTEALAFRSKLGI